MPRPPAPCGTISAAKRHRRKHEELDEACAQAERDEKNQREAKKRQEAADAAHDALPPAIAPSDAVDREEILRESLRVLRSHLLLCPPQSVAGITKAIRDTVEAIQGPATAVTQEVPEDDGDDLDDITRAYANRGA